MDAKTLSDNSRRTVCRLAFILLCALPLGLLIYKILHPVTATQWQQAIKAEFGLSTQIGSVETPLPFVTQFKDVVLFDDSGLNQLVHLDELQVISGATREIVIPNSVQLDASTLTAITQRLRESLRRTTADSSAWKLTVAEAMVTRPGEGLLDYRTFAPLEVSVFPNPEFTDANIEFALAENTQKDTVSISVHSYRNRSEEVFRLNTGDNYLPCWLVQDLWPEVEAFGPLCEFTGFAEIDRLKNAEWAANLRECEFDSIELKHLTQPFSKTIGQVTGLARARIHNCEIVQGQIHRLDLEVNGSDGSLDPVTANSASQFFETRWKDGERNFDSLDFLVNFESGYFRVSAPNPRGTIASYRNEATLWFTRDMTVDASQVAGFLGYSNDPNHRNVYNETVNFVSLFDIPQQRFAQESGLSPELRR